MSGHGFKQSVKNAVEALATAGGVSAWKRRRRALRGGCVILAYHQITDEIQNPHHAAGLIVSISEFHAQMSYLAQSGRVVSLAEAVRASLAPSRGKPGIAVTFDDGYAGVFENAFPILRKHGLPFAVFVTTGVIGTEKTLPGEERFAQVRYPKLGWDQVSKMAEAGAVIGAHGVTHRRLSAIPAAEAREEIERSGAEIERRTGRPTAFFAYPYGGPADHTSETERMIEESGYAAAFLCAGSTVDPPNRFRIDRAPIWSGMSRLAFRNLCDASGSASAVTELSRRLRGPRDGGTPRGRAR